MSHFDHRKVQPKPKNQVRWDPYVDQNPLCVACWHLHMLKKDQTSTGRPVLVDQEEEHEIDFKVPGLSHAVVREAEHLRVQELVKKIENHPHREALLAVLQQKNVYNPFSQ